MSEKIAKNSLINSQSMLNGLTKAFSCNALRGLRSIFSSIFLSKIEYFYKLLFTHNGFYIIGIMQ